MPVAILSTKVVNDLYCPNGKPKIDVHDASCKGLMLEIRESGGKTWYLRYRDGRGRQRQFRIADANDISLSQARKRVNKLRARIALGDDPLADREIRRAVPTFAEFVSDRYLPFVKHDKRSWKSDDSYLRNHLLPAFGKHLLDGIVKHEVISFHHGMREAGYAPGTANRCLVLLRYIFNLALRWDTPGITKNPTQGVFLFQDEKKCERYLTREEAQRLCTELERSANPQLRHIIPMLILTGARKREVLDAKWEDFDLEHSQWRIPFSKVGLRYVPLSLGVLQLLALIPKRDDMPYLFPSPKTDRPFCSIFYSWNTARRQAGMPELRIHDLRHSFASFLINSGRSLYEVQKILGHTQIRTTQRYAHLSQETLLDAANAATQAAGLRFSPAPVVRNSHTAPT